MIKKLINHFKSYGCTMFFDGDWCECCRQHGRVYKIGGTKSQRKMADQTLRECVVSKGFNPNSELFLLNLLYHLIIGWAMYAAVRLFGGHFWNEVETTKVYNYGK